MLGPDKLQDATEQTITLINPVGGRLLRQEPVKPAVFDSCLAAAQVAAAHVANKALDALAARFPARAETDCLCILHPEWWLKFVDNKVGAELHAATEAMKVEFQKYAAILARQFGTLVRFGLLALFALLLPASFFRGVCLNMMLHDHTRIMRMHRWQALAAPHRPWMVPSSWRSATPCTWS